MISDIATQSVELGEREPDVTFLVVSAELAACEIGTALQESDGSHQSV
jgi:hypothetical protein